MKLPKDAHLRLASKGLTTLQVPNESKVTVAYVDYPDDFFVVLKHDGSHQRAAVGREEGFLYLSKIGYDHYRADLKAAFDAASNKFGKTWADFELTAGKLYADAATTSWTQLQRLKLEESLKPTPYNKKRVTEMHNALLKL